MNLNLNALLTRAADLMSREHGPNWTVNPEYGRAIEEVLAPFVEGGESPDGDVHVGVVRYAVERAWVQRGQHRDTGKENPDLYVDAATRADCTGDCGQWPPDVNREGKCPKHAAAAYPVTGARHRRG